MWLDDQTLLDQIWRCVGAIYHNRFWRNMSFFGAWFSGEPIIFSGGNVFFTHFWVAFTEFLFLLLFLLWNMSQLLDVRVGVGGCLDRVKFCRFILMIGGGWRFWSFLLVSISDEFLDSHFIIIYRMQKLCLRRWEYSNKLWRHICWFGEYSYSRH